MSRINTNVSSLLAQRVLGYQNKGLVGNLERLSTGFRINRGADNPAGLIASENLRSEKAAISSAISLRSISAPVAASRCLINPACRSDSSPEACCASAAGKENAR